MKAMIWLAVGMLAGCGDPISRGPMLRDYAAEQRARMHHEAEQIPAAPAQAPLSVADSYEAWKSCTLANATRMATRYGPAVEPAAIAATAICIPERAAYRHAQELNPNRTFPVDTMVRGEEGVQIGLAIERIRQLKGIHAAPAAPAVQPAAKTPAAPVPFKDI